MLANTCGSYAPDVVPDGESLRNSDSYGPFLMGNFGSMVLKCQMSRWLKLISIDFHPKRTPTNENDGFYLALELVQDEFLSPTISTIWIQKHERPFPLEADFLNWLIFESIKSKVKLKVQIIVRIFFVHIVRLVRNVVDFRFDLGSEETATRKSIKFKWSYYRSADCVLTEWRAALVPFASAVLPLPPPLRPVSNWMGGRWSPHAKLRRPNRRPTLSTSFLRPNRSIEFVVRIGWCRI